MSVSNDVGEVSTDGRFASMLGRAMLLRRWPNYSADIFGLLL